MAGRFRQRRLICPQASPCRPHGGKGTRRLDYGYGPGPRRRLRVGGSGRYRSPRVFFHPIVSLPDTAPPPTSTTLRRTKHNEWSYKRICMLYTYRHIGCSSKRYF